MDRLICQDVVTASHSTCVLKLLLHLFSDEKTKNKVTEQCKVKSLESFGVLCVNWFSHYKTVLEIL